MATPKWQRQRILDRAGGESSGARTRGATGRFATILSLCIMRKPSRAARLGNQPLPPAGIDPGPYGVAASGGIQPHQELDSLLGEWIPGSIAAHPPCPECEDRPAERADHGPAVRRSGGRD